MKVLFLTLLDFKSITEHNIYTDLLREFVKNGHSVYAISPVEKRFNENTRIIKEGQSTILKLRIGNVQKTNLIEKGISTITLEGNFIKGIKTYFSDVKFDLVLYSTPPITLQKVVDFVKKRDKAKTYLLLKDIFPQNAVDLNMMSKSGIRGLFYRYFRNKEKMLYAISDRIGCMSPANCRYILEHNPTIDSDTVDLCCNSIEVRKISIGIAEKILIKQKYEIPEDKKVFIYGGNLGKPQGIDFIIQCLISQLKNEEVYFLIVGEGTEFNKLEIFFNTYKPKNMKLLNSLPKDDYDKIVAACDVGMIFLDYRFTIPNFPSRILSYMQNSLPVLACVDKVTDLGEIIEKGEFGWACTSDNPENFSKMIDKICKDNIAEKGRNARLYLEEKYTVSESYKKIMEKTPWK